MKDLGFRARLQHRINSYYMSERAKKVAWFKIEAELKPEEYKIQYRNGQLYLLGIVIPDKPGYWNALWEILDYTVPSDFIEEVYS